MENELGSKPVGKLLWKLSLPAIAAQLVNVLYNMVDRMYIGHIPDVGPAALTGVGVTMPVILMISAFAALVSMGGAPRAAIMMGRGRSDEAEKILGSCTAALVLLSVVLTAGILLFGREALLLFGASQDTIGYAYDYLEIYAIGTIAVQLTLGLNAFITAQGFSSVGMLTVVIGAVCNIVLDPIFIFALNMGVRGAALATVLSQMVSAVWCVAFLLGKKTILHIKACHLRIIPRVFGPCVALGLSPFVMQFTESILSLSFNSSLLKYGGDLSVGSMTILSSVMQFSMMPLLGFTRGAQPITGFNYGAGKKERVLNCYKLLLKVSLAYSAGFWTLCMLFPQMFAALFTSDAALIAAVVHDLRIYMGAMCLFGLQIACQQTFVAMGDAKTSLFLALLRKVFLLIPLIFILPLFLQNKVDAVLLAEPVSDFIAVCVTTTLSVRAMRRYMRKAA